VGAGSGVNLLIRYGFGFQIPHGERDCTTGANSRLDCVATKRLMRHFHIVLPAKIGNNVEQPFQA
jgi:hypothetical protein